MSPQSVSGLAPLLPPQRPRGPVRWWRAHGISDGTTLSLGALELHAPNEAPAPPDGLCGLAAPCSLPREFLAYLGLTGARTTALATLARWTPQRLFREARNFANQAQRGRRHPRRTSVESDSALQRGRLAAFHAALPLLRTTPTLPWDDASSALFEVDPPALLAALDLPAARFAGAEPEAVARRGRVLEALVEGALGPRVKLASRDVAVASAEALHAVLAAAAAAWLPGRPPRDAAADAWIPLP